MKRTNTMKQNNMAPIDNIKKLLAIMSSKEVVENNSIENEYDELLEDIKLIIHEFIDKYDATCKNGVSELINDIMVRCGIESDGHGLETDVVLDKLNELFGTFYDIYVDPDGYPRGEVDIFKYALATEMCAQMSKYGDSFPDAVEDDEETDSE